MAAGPAAEPPRVGELLRSWRQRRALTQLELSLVSAISTRHLSFVETGRSTPSREMILHLAEQLDVPLRERNTLLLAGGYAPLYQERRLEDAEMEPVRAAVDRFLRAHEPYPALVVDEHWDIVSANDALDILTAGVAPELLEPPANALRIALHPDGMARSTLNFAEWSAHIIHRLRRRALTTGDPRQAELYEELSRYPNVHLDPVPVGNPSREIVVPLRLRRDEQELAFLTTLATFGTATDVTLANLTIEAFYPADAQTANTLLATI
jgi:transcriptional regulator with XRE-family HTH domain